MVRIKLQREKRNELFTRRLQDLRISLSNIQDPTLEKWIFANDLEYESLRKNTRQKRKKASGTENSPPFPPPCYQSEYSEYDTESMDEFVDIREDGIEQNEKADFGRLSFHDEVKQTEKPDFEPLSFHDEVKQNEKADFEPLSFYDDVEDLDLSRSLGILSPHDRKTAMNGEEKGRHISDYLTTVSDIDELRYAHERAEKRASTAESKILGMQLEIQGLVERIAAADAETTAKAAETIANELKNERKRAAEATQTAREMRQALEDLQMEMQRKRRFTDDVVVKLRKEEMKVKQLKDENVKIKAAQQKSINQTVNETGNGKKQALVDEEKPTQETIENLQRKITELQQLKVELRKAKATALLDLDNCKVECEREKTELRKSHSDRIKIMKQKHEKMIFTCRAKSRLNKKELEAKLAVTTGHLRSAHQTIERLQKFKASINYSKNSQAHITPDLIEMQRKNTFLKKKVRNLSLLLREKEQEVFTLKMQIETVQNTKRTEMKSDDFRRTRLSKKEKRTRKNKAQEIEFDEFSSADELPNLK
eukprot:g1318.t1